MKQQITVPVRLDKKTFKRFSRFDMFRLRKRWVRPVVFALLLIAFAAVALLTRKAQSGMIAAVLLAIGIGLPLVYFGSFFSQVNVKAAQLDLGKGRPVYTVQLDFDGIRVTNQMKKEPTVTVPWKDAPATFKAKGCVYLYVSPARAFLLPDSQADADDAALWAYIEEHMGAKAKKI